MKHAFSYLRCAVAAFVLGGAATAGIAQTALPTAAVRNVTDTYFGTTVDDPYRYFENKADPEVAKWMKAHSDDAYAKLARIPGRKALLEKIMQYDSATSDRVAQVTRLPGDVYCWSIPRHLRRKPASRTRSTGTRRRRMGCWWPTGCLRRAPKRPCCMC
jgi:prolyl oligopeptidase